MSTDLLLCSLNDSPPFPTDRHPVQVSLVFNGEPNSRLADMPSDLIVRSSDAVYFAIHSQQVMLTSKNDFASLLPANTLTTPTTPTQLTLEESCVVLNSLFHHGTKAYCSLEQRKHNRMEFRQACAQMVWDAPDISHVSIDHCMKEVVENTICPDCKAAFATVTEHILTDWDHLEASALPFDTSHVSGLPGLASLWGRRLKAAIHGQHMSLGCAPHLADACLTPCGQRPFPTSNLDPPRSLASSSIAVKSTKPGVKLPPSAGMVWGMDSTSNLLGISCK
ncbi:hypothetical protein BC629DRAFT_1444115 [Irpex lacteus]|nr:hypothetical protein BC629DRAFT_1444115 [Irpex lacteus]